MGLDFLRRTAKTSRKAWDRGKDDLSTPSLFSQQPQCQTRTVSADLDDGMQVAAGEPVTFYLDNNDVLLVREKTRIGKLGAPTPDVRDAIRNCGGLALGEITQFNPLSMTADVKIQ